jgi:Flp pilus assembly pilin Flp
MAKRLSQVLRRLVRDESGQAFAEYVLVVSVTVAVLLGVSALVLTGLSKYFFDTTSVVCLPIP